MPDPAKTPLLIEMRDISKAFGPVQALRDINLTLAPGEILGLVGDNSAGKSTLMKVLTGAYTRDGVGGFSMDGWGVTARVLHQFDTSGHEWSNELRYDSNSNDTTSQTQVVLGTRSQA